MEFKKGNKVPLGKSIDKPNEKSNNKAFYKQKDKSLDNLEENSTGKFSDNFQSKQIGNPLDNNSKKLINDNNNSSKYNSIFEDEKSSEVINPKIVNNNISDDTQSSVLAEFQKIAYGQECIFKVAGHKYEIKGISEITNLQNIRIVNPIYIIQNLKDKTNRKDQQYQRLNIKTDFIDINYTDIIYFKFTDDEIDNSIPYEGEHQLEKFTVDPLSLNLSLDDPTIIGWNQFKANEKILKSVDQYKESLYTTVLDPSKINEEQLKEAEQKTKEIYNSISDENIHTKEDRNLITEKDYDEEAFFSSVYDKYEIPKFTNSALAKKRTDDINITSMNNIPNFFNEGQYKLENNEKSGKIQFQKEIQEQNQFSENDKEINNNGQSFHKGNNNNFNIIRELKDKKEEKSGKFINSNQGLEDSKNYKESELIESKKTKESTNQKEFNQSNNLKEKTVPLEVQKNMNFFEKNNKSLSKSNEVSKEIIGQFKFILPEKKVYSFNENKNEIHLDEHLKNSLQAAVLKSKSFIPSSHIGQSKKPVLNVNATPYEYAPPKFKLITNSINFRIHEFLKFQIKSDNEFDWKHSDKSIIEKKNQLKTTQISPTIPISNASFYPEENYTIQEYPPSFPIQVYPSNQMYFIPPQNSYDYPNYNPYNLNENSRSFVPRNFRPS